MSVKLFNPTQEGHDPKNRPVYICKTEGGKFYVYKPGTGYKSRLFSKEDDADLLNIFDYQKACSQNASFYRPGDEKKIPAPKAPAKEKQVKAPVVPPAANDTDEIYTV